MITNEEKENRHTELIRYADTDFKDFLDDWEHLCNNASPSLADFMKTAKEKAVEEILKMKDEVKINQKPLAYYLEETSCTFYEEDKQISSMFYCIWHVANSCVYKRSHGNLSDGFHCQYTVDNGQFFPYITLAMLTCLLWHTMSGITATVDITFVRIETGRNIMQTIKDILSRPEFKDVSKLNYYYTVQINH